MHTDTDTVDIDDIDAALDASADDKEQDAAPTFAELGVPKPLVHVLAMDGKVTAFPIQADTLADSLNGVDLLGRGQTGSGKTLAFAIPLVARLSEHSVTEVAMKEFEQIRKASDEKAAREQASLPRPRGLVLAPTRELVNQIDEVIQPLAEAYDMSTVTVYGGVSYARQVAGLRAGADIVVAADSSRFAQMEVQRCIMPTGGATLRMAERAGTGNALLHLLTADEFGFDELGDAPVVADQGRKPFLLVGSALTSIFVVGVVALAISLAVSIRPTVDQRPAPAQAAIVPSAPVVAPAPPPAATPKENTPPPATASPSPSSVSARVPSNASTWARRISCWSLGVTPTNCATELTRS